MNLEKINDIWLPKDLDTELQTNDMKVWFKYCKLQYKNFSHVIDMVGEYGIWARSMRLYAKKISSFQTNNQYIPAWIKNCERYNNISYFQNTFNLNSVPDDMEVVRIGSDKLEQFIKTDVPFIYVSDAIIQDTERYKVLFLGERDTVLYNAS